MTAPAGRRLAIKQAYFDRAKQVVDGLRGTNPVLESIFDQIYGKPPKAMIAEHSA